MTCTTSLIKSDFFIFCIISVVKQCFMIGVVNVNKSKLNEIKKIIEEIEILSVDRCWTLRRNDIIDRIEMLKRLIFQLSASYE